MNKQAVSITSAKNDPDKATIAFVVANAAVGSGRETLVWLSCEAVYLAVKGYADDIHEEGLTPLKELMDLYLSAGGTIKVCGTCTTKRNITADELIDGAEITGAATLVEFLDAGTPCVSY